MARYLFHLRDGFDVLLDPDGVELSADAIPGAALLHARDCIAGDVKNGRLDLNYHIDVHTEDGEVVHSLAFGDAFGVVVPRGLAFCTATWRMPCLSTSPPSGAPPTSVSLSRQATCASSQSL